MNGYFAVADLSGNLATRPALFPLVVRQDHDRVMFGARGGNIRPTPAIVYAILEHIRDSSAHADSVVRWLFSDVALKVRDLPALLERWDETGEPPLLSIIAVDIGLAHHSTRGLLAFIGYELTARFNDRAHAHEAARSLTRLARHAIMQGGLSPAVTYDSLGGSPLEIDWTLQNSDPPIVTICL